MYTTRYCFIYQHLAQDFLMLSSETLKWNIIHALYTWETTLSITPPESPAEPLAGANASSSSKNTTHGLAALACKTLKKIFIIRWESQHFANFAIMMGYVVSYPKGSELLKVSFPNKLMEEVSRWTRCRLATMRPIRSIRLEVDVTIEYQNHECLPPN